MRGSVFMNKVLERIFNLLSEKKISQKTFAEAIGEAPQTVSDWKKGRNNSYKNHIDKIASFLDVSVDYLLGMGENVPINIKNNSDEWNTILNGLSDESLLQLRDYTKYLYWKQSQAQSSKT